MKSLKHSSDICTKSLHLCNILSPEIKADKTQSFGEALFSTGDDVTD